jgi:alkanesulfonate monooxygenase SsuD/methylene tetrahydromethanopterin reductase-like flavin-dependent oxidoreductase (luciferase family)
MNFGLALDFWSTTKPLDRLLDDHVRLLAAAETLGFHSVWAGENRAQAPEPGHLPSPFLVLAAIARETNLRLGTGVTLLAGWHPAKLVYDAALLDQLSGGRFTLGMGLGNPGLMKQHGMAEEELGSRMDETLRFLKEMWSGASAFEGRYVRMKGRVYPPPVQAAVGRARRGAG